MPMFVELFIDEGSKCTFYTIRQNDASMNEAEKFFRRMMSDKEYKEDAERLLVIISDVIGEKYGADEDFFRSERKAQALPPSKKNNYSTIKRFKSFQLNEIFNSRLRLYCYAISESVVILFNGVVKQTKGSAQEDPNVSIFFYDAQRYVSTIEKAINDGMISEDGKYIVDFQGQKEFEL